MWTSIKHHRFFAKNAHTSSSITHCISEKHQDCSLAQEKHPIFQYQYFPVENADTLTQNSNHRLEKHWTNRQYNSYSGLQEEMYNMEGDM